MPTRIAEQLLSKLERFKSSFDQRHSGTVERLLRRLAAQRLTDADSLIHLHETLLFLCAYPQSRVTRRLTESMLRQFPQRLAEATQHEQDLNALDHPDVSGIAGRSVIDTFSYYIVRGLAARYAEQIALYWKWFEDENRLGQTWPRFMPLLEEDAFVEANIPYRSWLRVARDRTNEIPWLIERFNSLPLDDAAIAELYDSQKLYVLWTPPYRASRTGMRLPARLQEGGMFYHRTPLLQRRDVSLTEELNNPTAKLSKLSQRDGLNALELARDASTTRYRELYGFTHGDASRVIRAHLGRGVNLFVFGLLPAKRLPLRAYHAAMIFKNQVPVGYFEGLSIFERMESGFNLYYTFREGETGWLYAKTLAVMRQLLGVTTFALDPYQIGYENEEGIESGAFWFYRKFGFRPVDPLLLKLAQKEEEKIRTRKRYRTPAATLRKLASSAMVFELSDDNRADWDEFQIRRIGFAVQQRMAQSFKGDAGRLRGAAVRFAENVLQTNTRRLSNTQRRLFEDFAMILPLIPNISAWPHGDRQALLRIIEAKGAADEAKYLRLMQKHEKFRAAFIRLGVSRHAGTRPVQKLHTHRLQ